MVTVAFPLLPRAILSSAGPVFTAKQPNAFTVSESAVFAVRAPEVSVMVTVAVPLPAVVLAVRVRTLSALPVFKQKWPRAH
jgi:hypothetical protein